jgi:hypothetical protein
MDVDEAGRDDAMARRQFLAPASRDGADDRDAVTEHCDIGLIRGAASTVDYQAITYDEIVLGHRSSRRATAAIGLVAR